ncbi:MAG: O-antigen ligase family protein, partial [Chloroflexota bacterium]
IGQRELRWENDLLGLLLFFYLLACTLSILQNVVNPPPHAIGLSEVFSLRASGLRPLVQLFVLLTALLVYCLTFLMNQNRAQLMRSLRLFFAVSFVMCLYAFYQVFAFNWDLPFKDINTTLPTTGDPGSRIEGSSFTYGGIGVVRPFSTMVESVHLANLLLCTLPIMLALRLSQVPLANWGISPLFLNVNLLLQLTILVLTQSRGAWLGFLASLLVLAAYFPAKKYLPLAFALLAGLLSAGLVSSFVDPSVDSVPDFQAFLQGRLTQEAIYRELPRLQIWQIALDLFREHPLIGVGLGNFPLYAAARLQLPVLVSAHGLFQATLAETGLIGFFSLLAILVVFYWQMRQALRQFRASPYGRFCPEPQQPWWPS